MAALSTGAAPGLGVAGRASGTLTTDKEPTRCGLISPTRGIRRNRWLIRQFIVDVIKAATATSILITILDGTISKFRPFSMGSLGSEPVSTPPPHVPPAGVWCPAVTFFNHGTDQLDLSAQSKHFAHLAQSGLTGIVVLGTSSEAVLLTREERFLVVTTARKTVGPAFPLMAGVGAHSTKQTLQFAEDAARAGANYLLVLPPASFGRASMNVARRFFVEVAARSPLPVVINNFPGAGTGDIDSETVVSIFRESASSHPKGRSNIVGVKLTCGSLGEITRLSAALGPGQFSIFGGHSDSLIGGLVAGSSGCIAAFANVFPMLASRVHALYKQGRVDEAIRLQKVLALAESPCQGIAATKFAVACHSARAAGVDVPEEKLEPRHPYDPVGESAKKQVRESTVEAAVIEQILQSKARYR
ncbi:hypothetical protein G7Z17_g6737 [Cylindrodendrum hubeiense]|uniref:Dihydrodipicolinate synthase n=1 Tax=Cylindrodendrum hubeiense TaxID=595255 RepID=A0A9P5H8F4_9HYPO|nr:hypothetical protein G7Z17_g6737 [Cylindrodendrum hubeiense]